MPIAIDGKKTCARCRLEKPATSEHFSRATSRPDGFNSYCKECRNIPREQLKKQRSQFKEVDGVKYKTCTICSKWKGASSEFFFQSHGELTGHCKECLREKRGTKVRANRNDAKVVDGVLAKPCTKCSTWKPATKNYFSPFKEGKNGLHPWCRDCLNKDAAERALKSGKIKSHHDKVELVDGTQHRKCRTCGTWMPATPEYFQPQAGCKMGLRPTCRLCMRVRSIAYAEANKEKAVARVLVWIEKNKARHRQHVLAVKAKRRAAEGSFIGDDIQRHFDKQKGKCYYCLVDLDQTYEVDHFIPLSKGGANFADNIVLACKACNRAKSAKDPFKFLEKMRIKAALEGLSN